MKRDRFRTTNATRRCLLKTGVSAVAGSAMAAPYIRNAEAATTTTWKVQTSWPAGIGLNTFKTCVHFYGRNAGESRDYRGAIRRGL